jgi:plasmid stabilization system protein ParE
MTLPIVFRRGVERDLAAAFRWYEAQRAGLGEEFLAAARSSFESIQSHPEIYALVHGEVRRIVLSRFPYAVFYTIQPRRVLVLAVLHTARDPKLWPRLTKRAR